MLIGDALVVDGEDEDDADRNCGDDTADHEEERRDDSRNREREGASEVGRSKEKRRWSWMRTYNLLLNITSLSSFISFLSLSSFLSINLKILTNWSIFL